MSASSNTARSGAAGLAAAAGLDAAPAFGWTLACVAATGLHAALLWHLATRPPVLIDPIGAPAAAVEIDLEPVVSTPEAQALEPARTAEVAPPPSEAAPTPSVPPDAAPTLPVPPEAAPEMTRPEPAPAEAPPPETVAEPLPKEPPPPETPPEIEKTASVQPEPPPPGSTPSVPPAPESVLPIPPDAAVLPPPPAAPPTPVKPVEAHKPPPKRQQAERRPPEQKRRQPDRPTPPRMADARPAPGPAPAPAPAASSAPSNAAAAAAWKQRLSSHLNRHKRFPPGAGTGVSVVAFTIGVSGDVVSARLVRSSGDAALDAEAVALPRRASPLPSPPTEVARGGSITLSVPVRFSH